MLYLHTYSIWGTDLFYGAAIIFSLMSYKSHKMTLRNFAIWLVNNLSSGVNSS